ncbi:MAG: ATP-binding protein [Proteobacteria bacterium]|nr:ATP-binding protein [Pseudomonadota bacterium]
MNRIVLVSGAPGVGKSTLAVPLAQSLGFALLSKDAIKETLFDSLPGPVGDEAYSKRLGDAAMEVLFTLAARCPRVVLDANFKPWGAHQRKRLAALGGTLVEVHCHCAPETAMRRFAQRAESRHPAHALKHITVELIARYTPPMGVGTVIEVDTNGPVDNADLLRRVQELLRGT